MEESHKREIDEEEINEEVMGKLAYLEEIYSIIEQSKSIGYKEIENGAKLIGHVPHVAPEAYFHIIFSPLNDKQIGSLEKGMGKEIPVPLRDFYYYNNGISLFSGNLSIDGFRKNYKRTGEDVWQPFNIVDLNVENCPPDTEDHQLLIGGYESDGSYLYIDNDSLKVYRCSSETVEPLHEWKSFEVLMLSEVKRLAKLFNKKGEPTVDIEDLVP